MSVPDTSKATQEKTTEAPAGIIIDPEFRSLIPPLSDEERRILEENIVAAGEVHDPLVGWAQKPDHPQFCECAEPAWEFVECSDIDARRGEFAWRCTKCDAEEFDYQTIILDGHNRLDIAQKHNLPYKIKSIDLPDRDGAKAWMILNQLGRRNLTDFARAELALQLKPLIAAKAKANLRTSTGGANPQPLEISTKAEPLNTREELAKVAKVSADTIRQAEFIRDNADEATKQKLRTDPKAKINTEAKRLRNKAKPKAKRRYAGTVKLSEPTKEERDAAVMVALLKNDTMRSARILISTLSREYCLALAAALSDISRDPQAAVEPAPASTPATTPATEAPSTGGEAPTIPADNKLLRGSVTGLLELCKLHHAELSMGSLNQYVHDLVQALDPKGRRTPPTLSMSAEETADYLIKRHPKKFIAELDGWLLAHTELPDYRKGFKRNGLRFAEAAINVMRKCLHDDELRGAMFRRVADFCRADAPMEPAQEPGADSDGKAAA